MENNELDSIANLMHVTKSLIVYRHTISFSVGVLLIQCFIMGSTYLFFILFENFPPEFAFFPAVFFCFIGVILFLYTFLPVIKKIPSNIPNESLIWISSYFFPALIIYFVIIFLLPIYYLTMFWYPSVGIGNLFIGISIEKTHYKRKNLLTRPFFYQAVFILLSCPLLLIYTILYPDEASRNYSFLTMGLSLVISVLCTYYVLSKMERKVDS